MKIETYQIDTIKQKVSVHNAVSLYLPKYHVDTKGFMCCPFHNEKTPSMKLHDSYYHCFGCGKSGDVIALVKDLFNLKFTSAVAKLDKDFCCNLNLGASSTFSQRIKAYNITRQAEQKRKASEKLKKRELDTWLAFKEKLTQLCENKKKYKPKPTDTSLHPLFVQAISEIPRYLAMWDEYDMKIKEERERHGCG